MKVEFDTLLFDLDGTVYLNDTPFPGVVNAINAFLEPHDRMGIALTNNSSKTRAVYESKLERIGLNCEKISVVTPIEVGAEFLRGQGLSRAYILGTGDCISEFKTHGICFDDQNPQCVVICFDTECTYQKLSRCAFWMERGLPTFQTNTDLFCPTALGAIPDCGSLAALLTATTGVVPQASFGKPDELLANYVRKHFLIDRRQTAMFGDRIVTDIAFGRNIGATTVWVRTGDPSTSAEVQPDYVSTSMAEFLNAII